MAAALAVAALLTMACQATSAPSSVHIVLSETGAPLNELFTLWIDVSGASPDEVLVDADMPGHKHGMMTRPVVRPAADGLWRADGMLLHMPGRWEIYVTIVRGGARERTTFPLEVGP